MKISDKIRKWADDLDSDDAVCTTATLYFLADRIDREMVELPRDANGVPIHVTDLVYMDDGRRACVTEIDIERECEAIDCWDGSKHVAYHPSGITHERPDSWELIADDLDEMVDAADSADDMCEILANFADRIRRLAAREAE